MSTKINSFQVKCPFCKQMIQFQLNIENLEFDKTPSGLVSWTVVHGDPLHALVVYVDKNGKIRGSYYSPVAEGKGSDVEQAKQALSNVYVVDSACDITLEEARVRGIYVVPATIVINKKEKKKYLRDISFEEAFDRLIKGDKIETEPPTKEEFKEIFLEALKLNKPVVAILVDKKLSKTYENAELAKKEIMNEEPSKGKLIHLVDSKPLEPGKNSY